MAVKFELDEITKVEAPSVEVADPTGAGDAFVGVPVALSIQMIQWRVIAVRAGAAAVRKVGAQLSMPRWVDIDNL